MIERTPVVYLIRLGDTDYFKVGMTTDINGRVAALQTATPFELHLISAAEHRNAMSVERDMHEMLKAYHVRNEWFQCEQVEIVRIFEIASAMATIDCALDDPDLERQVLEMEAAPTLPPMLRQAPANQQIEAMLQQGYSYRQIERTLNVSHATIAQVRRSLRSAALQSAIFDDEKDDSFIEAT
jgi:hypothetical protein